MGQAGRIGFIGLGNMGSRMATNMSAKHQMLVYDAAGTAKRAPPGSHAASSVIAIAAAVDTVLLSLPDGAATASVTKEILACTRRRVGCVVDTSTIGIQAARDAHQQLNAADVTYIDAPVSGGTAGAAAATLSMMFAGAREAYEQLLPLLTTIARNIFHVGSEAGQGQAMKLCNNFLSGLAMAGTSEALCFGLRQGLDMETMLDVLNASTGRNSATQDKFPDRVLSGTYDAGFQNTLYMKDLNLYLDGVNNADAPCILGETCADVWKQFVEAQPGADFTEIFPFIQDPGRTNHH